MTINKHKFPWAGWLAWVALGLVVFLFALPWMLGLPGWIDSTRFRSGLHAGMSRGEILRLREKTNGDGIVIEPDVARAAELNSSALPVWYARALSLCFVAGDVYLLHFDKTDHLASWRVDPWYGGC